MRLDEHWAMGDRMYQELEGKWRLGLERVASPWLAASRAGEEVTRETHMNKEGFMQMALASLFTGRQHDAPRVRNKCVLSQSGGTGREQATKLPCSCATWQGGWSCLYPISNDHWRSPHPTAQGCCSAREMQKHPLHGGSKGGWVGGVCHSPHLTDEQLKLQKSR